MRGKPVSLRMEARALWGTMPSAHIAQRLGISDKLLYLWVLRGAWGPSYYAQGNPVPSPRGGERKRAVPVAQSPVRPLWRCQGCGRLCDQPVCPCGQKGPFANGTV